MVYIKSWEFRYNNRLCSIDWDDFLVTTVNVSGETAPFVSKGLKYITLDEWNRYYRDQENLDDADTQSHGEPARVYRSPDNRKFGLSPIPDKVYNVHFYAFEKPTALSAHGDTIAFPDQYSNVITAELDIMFGSLKTVLNRQLLLWKILKKV